jgi:hypothetical protein
MKLHTEKLEQNITVHNHNTPNLNLHVQFHNMPKLNLHIQFYTTNAMKRAIYYNVHFILSMKCNMQISGIRYVN